MPIDARPTSALPAAEPPPQTGGAFARRGVLVGGAAAAALLALQSCKKDAPDAPDAGVKPPAPAPGQLSQEDQQQIAAELPTLVAIADRLLPSDEHGPGAKEAGIEAFLTRFLADPRARGVGTLLRRGAGFLQRAAQTEQQKTFVDLDDAQKDALLTRLSTNQMRPTGFSGPQFVRVFLAVTLEGFLGDPVHGGNVAGKGWAVVGYNPAGRGAT